MNTWDTTKSRNTAVELALAIFGLLAILVVVWSRIDFTSVGNPQPAYGTIRNTSQFRLISPQTKYTFPEINPIAATPSPKNSTKTSTSPAVNIQQTPKQDSIKRNARLINSNPASACVHLLVVSACI